jgi:hypothetical protein
MVQLKISEKQKDVQSFLRTSELSAAWRPHPPCELAFDLQRRACKFYRMAAPHEHKGWCLPRSLPYFDTPERPQFITFRLGDSLPTEVAVQRSGEG